MPPELELEEADASLDQDDADAVEQTVEQSANADSSAATDASKPEGESTLSIVRDVVAKGEKVDPAGASSADEVEDGSKARKATTPKEPDDENFSDVPFNKHPRFQTVLGRLKEAETDAQRYRNVESYVANQGLDAAEAADVLRIGGLAKTNPQAAWAEIQPWLRNLAIAAGELLPDDLKAKVEQGALPRDAAIEISRSRAAAQSAEARTQWDRQREQTRQVETGRRDLTNAVSAWEAERKVRDPNFDAKLPALQRELAWLHATEGKASTPEAARAQLQKAYDAVAKVAAPAPQRRQIRPVNGGQVNGNVRPEISSTLDVVNAVVARRAG